MIKKKSIVTNASLNAIKTICTIVFPLITFPYVSRVLQVENLGVYNFCTSIISYVTLFASLGINTYAVREGARCRDNTLEMSNFASELFTINLFSTVLSYFCFFVLLFFVPKLQQNSIILLILSISVFCQTIGCEWIFNIYEEFGYITLRSIFFQIISLVLLFAFVHTKDDLIAYSIISVVASSGANLINFFVRRKYFRIRIVLNRNVLARIVPILILFANTLATNVYINSDMTMVGIFCGDYYVGLYSVSTKLYFILKNLLSAIIVVSIPRLSAYVGGRNLKAFSETARNILNSLVILVTPVVVGLFSIAKNIIIIIAGQEYKNATLSLQLLSFALLFCLFGWFYNSCVLIPNKQDKKVLFATVMAALSNVIMNLFFIPIWAHNAAAFTTMIAEMLSMIICFGSSRKYFKASFDKKDIVTVVLGNFCIYIICKIIILLNLSVFVSTIFCIGCSILAYFFVLKLGKNQAILYIETILKERLNVIS